MSKLVTLVQAASATLAALKGQQDPCASIVIGDEAVKISAAIASSSLSSAPSSSLPPDSHAGTGTGGTGMELSVGADNDDGDSSGAVVTNDNDTPITTDAADSARHADTLTPHTDTKAPASISPFPPSSSAPLSNSDIAALEQQLSASGATLRDAFERLSRSRAEEESCLKKAQLEESRIEETVEWMLAMQGVLWPENVPDRELGRPILPERPLSPSSPRSPSKPSDPSSQSERGTDGREGKEGKEGEGDDVAHEEEQEEQRPIESTDISGARKFLFYVPIPKAPPLKPAHHCSRSKDLLSYGTCVDSCSTQCLPPPSQTLFLPLTFTHMLRRLSDDPSLLPHPRP